MGLPLPNKRWRGFSLISSVFSSCLRTCMQEKTWLPFLFLIIGPNFGDLVLRFGNFIWYSTCDVSFCVFGLVYLDTFCSSWGFRTIERCLCFFFMRFHSPTMNPIWLSSEFFWSILQSTDLDSFIFLKMCVVRSWIAFFVLLVWVVLLCHM